MFILAIESSCDESAAAVVRDGCEVLSSVIASQAALHAATGGVVPEIAAREHVGAIIPAVRQALDFANISLAEIDAIAVTAGPGLAGSLLAGVVAANSLARFADLPLIPVQHIHGHVRSIWLDRDPAEIQLPAVTLTASGGHSELVLLRPDGSLTELGATTDDAAGEAFDKAARLLGLGYPGGPAIQEFAKQGRPGAVPTLPRAWGVPGDVARNFDSAELGVRLRAGRIALPHFDFSFSGLKSELRRRVAANPDLSEQTKADLALAFQDAVADVLATKPILAAQKFAAKEIHLAGGVSANLALRARISELAEPLGLPVRWPAKLSYCTDNAAMVGAAAFFDFARKPELRSNRATNIAPNLALDF